jgi:hypothetical protein
MLLLDQLNLLKLILDWSNVTCFSTHGLTEANVSPIDPHFFQIY